MSKDKFKRFRTGSLNPSPTKLSAKISLMIAERDESGLNSPVV